MKKVIVLGATGSIGKSSLSVITSLKDKFKVEGLSAHTSKDELLKLGREFNTQNLVLTGTNSKNEGIRYSGIDGLTAMLKEADADIVINGIAGSSGLIPSMSALENGKNLALANKETLVMAGKLVQQTARKNNLDIIPVDSEHSAIFQLLACRKKKDVSQIILTASGGPFLKTPLKDFDRIKLEDTLKHPTWSMGKKISIDSATMANKGLEVIEACELFSFDSSQIKVLIQPESRVHSLIRMITGEMYAQISEPDMKLPIQNALTYPDILKSSFGYLDLAGKTISFINPDKKKYPLLYLAFDAVKAAGSYSLAYNAANEVAVDSFLKGNINFTDIYKVVEKTLQRDWSNYPENIAAVLEYNDVVKKESSAIVEDLF